MTPSSVTVGHSQRAPRVQGILELLRRGWSRGAVVHGGHGAARAALPESTTYRGDRAPYFGNVEVLDAPCRLAAKSLTRFCSAAYVAGVYGSWEEDARRESL